MNAAATGRTGFQPVRTQGESLCRLTRRLNADESGASMIEFALLLAGVAIPMYVVIRIGLAVLVGHYQMTTFMTGWPFP